jgi:hypothetical protein
MYTKSYLDAVSAHDPILAEQLAAGKVPPHRPVWNSNNLTETRDLTEDEVQELEDWIPGR